jgi:hypothetical protein
MNISKIKKPNELRTTTKTIHIFILINIAHSVLYFYGVVVVFFLFCEITA